MEERDCRVPLRSGKGRSSQCEPLVLRGRVEAAYIRRWSAVLACSAAQAFSMSLLDRRRVRGTGGDVLSMHEVLQDAWFFRGGVSVLLGGSTL